MNIKIKGAVVVLVLATAVFLSLLSIGGTVSAGGGEITIVDDINIVDRLEPVLEEDEETGNPKIITGDFKPGEIVERQVSVHNEGVEQEVAFSFKFIEDEQRWTFSPGGIRIFITPVQGEGIPLSPGEFVLLPRQSITDFQIGFEILANPLVTSYQEVHLFLERMVKGELKEATSLLIGQNFEVAESIVIEGRTKPQLSRENVLSFHLIMQNVAQVEQTISVDFVFWLTILNEDGTINDTRFYRGWQYLHRFPRQVEITIGKEGVEPQRPVPISAATEADIGRTFIPIEVRFFPGPDLYHFGMKLLVTW